MKVQQLHKKFFYYTNLVSEQDKQILRSNLDEEDNWIRIYDDGKSYDPNRDPDAESSQTLMLTFRKAFDDLKYRDFLRIINDAYVQAVSHYKEVMGITSTNPLPVFAHIDKHLTGTVYMTHIDSAPVGVESFTMLMYLNDDYTGGEISFSLPETVGNLKVVNGIVQGGPKGTYRPTDDEIKDMITFWLKPEAFSIVIFPPLDPYPHTVHEITSGQKFIIKGHWQVDKKDVMQWSADPYVGLTEEEISKDNGAFARHNLIFQARKTADKIVPDSVKEFYME